ncbi:---NA--- [Paramuricea clavata]|uniref:---NA n=1 Tax=Paramuricea clavata TaxID=317549 RepID=A0A7D9IVV5_PARCT|nr:---NA--- [Paramuricea clavata]
MASQVCCDHGQLVFVIGKLQFITCVSNPINDICPVNHKVPDQILPNRTVISQLLNSTSVPLRSTNASESCIAANKMFLCSLSIYTCNDNERYFYRDTEIAYRLCMDARDICTGLEQLFNCSLYRNATMRHSKGVTCNEYQKLENDTCPMRNYKVPSYVDFQNVTTIRETAQSLLTQNNVETNCTNNVLNTICDIGYPACTTDEKYSVSLIGKKKCLEIMKCVESVNNTNLTNSAMQLCSNLPEEDMVKNLSIHTIENQMTTVTSTTTLNPNATSTTTLDISTTPMCCGASRLSAMSHILVVFIVWFFLGSFAK